MAKLKTASSADEPRPNKSFTSPGSPKKPGLPDKKDYRNKEQNRDYMYNKAENKPRKPEPKDPDYEKFKSDYLSRSKGGIYYGYRAPDGSWHGHPGAESAIKAHYKWSKMSNEEKKKTRERNDHISQKTKTEDKHTAPNVKPKSTDPMPGEHKKPYQKPKKEDQYNRSMGPLSKKMEDQKKSIKVVALKKKTPESIAADKQKAKDAKKPASRARATGSGIKKTAKKKDN
jgi:hypothetical protein